MTELRLILTAVTSRAEAERLAQALLEEQLARCINIVGPVDSRYWWKGAIERSEEFMLIIKSAAGAVDSIEERVLALHSYELPEFIVLPIEAGNAAYLAWIAEGVRPQK